MSFVGKRLDFLFQFADTRVRSRFAHRIDRRIVRHVQVVFEPDDPRLAATLLKIGGIHQVDPVAGFEQPQIAALVIDLGRHHPALIRRRIDLRQGYVFLCLQFQLPLRFRNHRIGDELRIESRKHIRIAVFGDQRIARHRTPVIFVAYNLPNLCSRIPRAVGIFLQNRFFSPFTVAGIECHGKRHAVERPRTKRYFKFFTRQNIFFRKRNSVIPEAVCIPLFGHIRFSLLLHDIRIFVCRNTRHRTRPAGIHLLKDHHILDGFFHREPRFRIQKRRIGRKHQPPLYKTVHHDALIHRTVTGGNVACRPECIDPRGIIRAAAAAGHRLHILIQLEIDGCAIFTASETNRVIDHPPLTFPGFRQFIERVDQVRMVILHRLGRCFHRFVDLKLKRSPLKFILQRFEVADKHTQMVGQVRRKIPRRLAAHRFGGEPELLVFPLPVVSIQPQLVIITAVGEVVSRLVKIRQLEKPGRVAGQFNSVADLETNRLFE